MRKLIVMVCLLSVVPVSSYFAFASDRVVTPRVAPEDLDGTVVVVKSNGWIGTFVFRDGTTFYPNQDQYMNDLRERFEVWAKSDKTSSLLGATRAKSITVSRYEQ